MWRAQGAEEMNRMEHLLNVYAAKNARGAVAEFLGYCEVARTEASTKLTEGVWLVRRFQQPPAAEPVAACSAALLACRRACFFRTAGSSVWGL